MNCGTSEEMIDFSGLNIFLEMRMDFLLKRNIDFQHR
jgi:hypothetical protein